MLEFSGDQRQRLSIAWAFAILAALLTGFLQQEILKYGMLLTPDGWGYWQGSVSLLRGRGYRYFFGPSITYWPPLYPLYLAAWESVFGVSGRTLVLANLALGCAAALNWTLLFSLPTFQSPALDGRKLPGAILYSLLVAVFLATTIAAHFTQVLAHNLVYTLLPLFFLVTFLLGGTGRTARQFLALAGVDGLLVALLLLTHNSSVAFLPGLVLLVFLCRSQTRLVRALAAVVASAPPFALWLLVRWYLGQLGSHNLSFGASRYPFVDYLGQLASELADLLAPPGLGVGWLFLIALCVIMGLGLARTRGERDPICAAGNTCLILAAVATVCLLGIFNLTWIYDPLSDRFLLFLPLTLFPAAVYRYWYTESRGREKTPPPPGAGSFGTLKDAGIKILLAGVVAVAVCRCLSWVALLEPFHEGPKLSRLNQKSLVDFAYNRLTIDPGFIDRPPVQRGDSVLVSPPLYPWIRIRITDPNAPEDSWKGRWEPQQ